ncbi:protein tyrosine phosphatase family protein [Sphingomonas sp. RS6]
MIDDRISVSPQILPDDVAALAAAGFTYIINNRPEGEESGQPSGDAIAAAAAAAGLGYAAIPVTPGGFSMAQVEAMDAALAEADGPVLAYCRSGTRSCNLWALASARRGDDPDTLIAKAAAAGYDLSAIRPALEQLSAVK